MSSELNGVAGIYDTYRVTHYACTRKTRGGHSQMVSIEVWDAGEGKGEERYHATARREDGRAAHGNVAGSVREAVANIHWNELD